MPKPQRRPTKAQQRRDRQAAAEARAASSRHLRARIVAAVGVLVALGVAIAVFFGLRGAPSTTTSGPASTAAPTATAQVASLTKGATGATVDGVPCGSSEATNYHVHAHLAVFVNGDQRVVPAGIGIPGAQTTQTADGPEVSAGTCFYWLHSHTEDGVIHVEAPRQQAYTLGQYFDIWGAPLSSSQVGDATGTVIVYVNGQLWSGSPRDVPLTAHALIQLDVGSNVVPQPFTFSNGL